MDTEYVINGVELKKKYKGFELSIPELKIPKGFATALIGENGAGKTTLLNMMSGLRLDYTGNLTYFDEKSKIDDGQTKEKIGYTGPNNYFLQHWTHKQVKEINQLMFDNFSTERFDRLCEELDIPAKKVKNLSDGNRMKLMLAGVLARDTELLLLDEPASPLDPLMRDRLCEMLQKYINDGEGKRSVFFSTHNIADMENITDYAIIMEKGQIIEEGFVEELKEKYIIVKGESEDAETAAKVLKGISISRYGFEGLCRSDELEKLAGMQVAYETPTLSQICIAIMKEYTSLKKLS